MARHCMTVVVPPESFLVDKKNHLLLGEVERRRKLGARAPRQGSGHVPLPLSRKCLSNSYAWRKKCSP